MAQKMITEKYAKKIIALVNQKDIDFAANTLGVSRETVSRYLREAKNRYGMTSDTGTKAPAITDGRNEKYIISSDIEETKAGIKMDAVIRSDTGDRVKILNDFLELTKIDLKIWEVDRFSVGAWDTTMSGNKSSTKNDSTYTNYSIKVFLKKRDLSFDQEEFLKQFNAILKHHNTGKPGKLEIKKVDGEFLLVITINDLHLGRQSWYEETGKNYDSKIAAKYMRDGIEKLISMTDGFKISHILYYVGNDFFTYDHSSPYPATTHGTPQEADSRWQKMFMMGESLQIYAIKMLSLLAPVTVQEVSGNHDEQASFYLGRVLRSVFANDENVEVSTSPSPRKYFRWGNTLIGAAHGKYEKPKDLHAVMLAEAKDKMIGTKYWYFVLGHKHHFEERRQRVLKAPTITDQTLHGLKHYEEVDEDYMGLTITYQIGRAHV